MNTGKGKSGTRRPISGREAPAGLSTGSNGRPSRVAASSNPSTAGSAAPARTARGTRIGSASSERAATSAAPSGSTVSRTQRPSSKLDAHRTSNPFASKRKFKTNFGQAFTSGAIPCHINHGSVKHSLHWDTPPEQLPFSPLLLLCAEGFLETEHPFVLLAPRAFIELVESDGAINKVVPLLPKVAQHVRVALSSSDRRIFGIGLEAARALSATCGPHLNAHINSWLAPLNRKIFDSTYSVDVNNLLLDLEANGGQDVAGLIKAKIPTYTSGM